MSSTSQIIVIVSGVLTVAGILPVAIHWCYQYFSELLRKRRHQKEKKLILGKLFSKKQKRKDNMSEWTVKSLTAKECCKYTKNNSIQKISLDNAKRARDNEVEETHNDGAETKRVRINDPRHGTIQDEPSYNFTDFSFHTTACTTGVFSKRSVMPSHEELEEEDPEMQMEPDIDWEQQASRKLESTEGTVLHDTDGTAAHVTDGTVLHVSGPSSQKTAELDTRRSVRKLEFSDSLRTFKTIPANQPKDSQRVKTTDGDDGAQTSAQLNSGTEEV